MKTYHSIPKYTEEDFGKYIYAFDKIDGSNFKAEWDRKLSKKTRFTNGFAKFGTRGQMIKNASNPFYEGIEIFRDKFAHELDEIFRTHKTFWNIDKITVYGEFFGDNSFAGMHDWKEPHDIYLYDVFLYKKGFLPPSDFIKIFDEEVDCCKKFYQGIFTEEVLKHVEDGDLTQWQYPHSTQEIEEGVVCKGIENQKVFMFKIKTNKWLSKVKELYGETAVNEY